MRFVGLIVAGLSTLSCGYHVAGRADTIPKAIRTLAIPAFSNATTRYKLTDRVPEAVAREFISRTRYRVVNDLNEADAILSGSIVNYFAYPIVFDQVTARASVVEIGVIVSATLTERATGKVLYRNPSFEVRQQYEITADQLAFFEESDTAMIRVSRDIARTLVSAVLENF